MVYHLIPGQCGQNPCLRCDYRWGEGCTVWYTVLHKSILYCTTLYCTILSFTSYSVLYCTVPYYTLLPVVYCTVLPFTSLFLLLMIFIFSPLPLLFLFNPLTLYLATTSFPIIDEEGSADFGSYLGEDYEVEGAYVLQPYIQIPKILLRRLFALLFFFF